MSRILFTAIETLRDSSSCFLFLPLFLLCSPPFSFLWIPSSSILFLFLFFTPLLLLLSSPFSSLPSFYTLFPSLTSFLPLSSLYSSSSTPFPLLFSSFHSIPSSLPSDSRYFPLHPHLLSVLFLCISSTSLILHLRLPLSSFIFFPTPLFSPSSSFILLPPLSSSRFSFILFHISTFCIPSYTFIFSQVSLVFSSSSSFLPPHLLSSLLFPLTSFNDIPSPPSSLLLPHCAIYNFRPLLFSSHHPYFILHFLLAYHSIPSSCFSLLCSHHCFLLFSFHFSYLHFSFPSSIIFPLFPLLFSSLNSCCLFSPPYTSLHPPYSSSFTS